MTWPRLAFALVLTLSATTAAQAASTCDFDVAGATMRLVADCTTDTTILIPDGGTLDGRHHTITAVDPVGGHFIGAVVANGGAVASIVDTHIAAQSLADVCDGGPSRLRGIFFDGAAGVIRGNEISDINQGASRCQEGNAIEVRSLADGDPSVVEIDRNVVSAFQKGGIVVTGTVDAWVHDNRVGASADQDLVPANGIQIGYGAWALVERNRVAGNSWLGYPATADAATAILLYRAAPGTTAVGNVIDGNADVGIYIVSDGAVVENNDISDDGVDSGGGYDIGIGDYGVGTRVSGNRVRGYRVPYESLTGSARKTAAAR